MKSVKNCVSDNIIGSSVIVNPSLLGLKCLRCGKEFSLENPLVDGGLGCDKCLSEGFPVVLRCVYRADKPLSIDNSRSGMFRFASRLPFSEFPSLGEGHTPLISLPRLASEFGIAALHVKNEGQNPTGSHKDRMSPVAVARAISSGFSKVVASSSGNAGASLASYAARAGVECRIFAAHDISAQWEHAIRLAGADLRKVDDRDRWPLMQKMVQEDQWFPVTNFWTNPVGSNPFGIEGYKTIAHEIADQQREVPPTVVIVPTCRGDVLAGIYYGFVEACNAGLIREVPKLVAVEPGPRLELILQGADYRSFNAVPPNNMVSIDGDTATYQSVNALQSSNGMAVSVSAQDSQDAQKVFAENGFHVEMSSAASLAGLRKLQAQLKLKATDRVVLIATSHGYKELPSGAGSSESRLCN